MKKEIENNLITRPPVIVVMGHIDHGKSTLLDYLRKTNIVEKEVGGITQAISAYEVNYEDENKILKKITFLDTPGHAAFTKMRERGAQIADIAILVVSAEDGVKPQTIEAWKTITASQLPCIVAINKIDKENANIEKTKNELAENEIYLENYGGKVPCVPISAKNGDGIDELLSMLLILAEMENLKANSNEDASGYVLESNLDPKRGIQATLIIKNGTLKKGMVVVVENTCCSVRMMENFLGKNITEATFSSPVRLIGFDKNPLIGSQFNSFKNKESALSQIKNCSIINNCPEKNNNFNQIHKKIIGLVLKADVGGSLEAIEKEINQIKTENTEFKIIVQGIGSISESDIKKIATCENALIIGFNVKIDKSALDLAEQRNIPVSFFNIIYKLTEYLEIELEKRRIKQEKVQINGKAKILKIFNKNKDKQVLGAKVIEGKINLNNIVKIIRRENEIGKGKIINLEKNKNKISEIENGSEFGMMLESKIEIALNDILESFSIIEE